MTSTASTEIWRDIRPYLDSEVHDAVEQLLADQEFCSLLDQVLPNQAEALKQGMLKSQTIQEIKLAFGYNIIRYILQKTAFSCDLSGTSRLGGDTPATFVSNHRDIILDTGILNVLLADKGYRLPRIAIGDNLFARPWIKEVVRLMDSVTVKRAESPRDFLASSQALSAYILHSITQDKASLWIAQREGRAKDSNDRTQPALLKMLAIAGEGSIIDRLVNINTVPVSISYEYDPCDYLKAMELLARQQNGEYHKSPGEDVLNMREGLMGKKGRIHVTIGTPLRELISEVELPKSPKDQLLLAAELIDREIHRHYRLYPANYIADDLLRGSTHHHTAGHYSSKEQGEFERYIEAQLDKCPTPQEARPHLRQQMLLMYANPLRNHLLAIKGGE